MKFIVVAVALAILGCSNTHKPQHTLYQCPMHPSYTSDQPGTCPICGMSLVPVATDKGVEHESHGVPSRAPIVVTEHQRQQIGLQTAKVEQRELNQEIRTVGQVAFDPELAIAQREFLEAKRLGDTSLAAAATERLQLMGMSRAQIDELTQSRRVQRELYLPSSDGKVWVYATLYEPNLSQVAVGQEVVVTIPDQPGIQFKEKVVAIDPIVDAMTRTVRARTLINDTSGTLKPGRYVDVTILIPLGQRLAIPASSVLGSGSATYAFVDRGEGKLKPRHIVVGPRAGGDVPVFEGLTDGEIVVTNASFLIDAESSLRAAVEALGEKKTTGGHVH